MARGFDASQYYYRNCAELEVFKAYHRDLPNIAAFVNRLLVLPAYPAVPGGVCKSARRGLARDRCRPGPMRAEGVPA